MSVSVCSPSVKLTLSISLGLAVTLQVGSYLLAEAFLSRCLSALAGELSPSNCRSYLSVAQDICCPEMKATVLAYISRNLMEMSDLVR